MEEKPENEPEYWTYQLFGGQFDGAEGRQAFPCTTVCRPSHVDRRVVEVYHVVRTDAAKRHATYRYHHDMPAVIATDQDR